MGKKIIKCPKCKGVNIEHLGGRTKTSLNFNPLHPLTLVNHDFKGKQTWRCEDCGCVFEKKL